MRVSKGKTQDSNGNVCNHLYAFNPTKTASPIATSICVPRLAYRTKSRLLLFDGGLLLIIIHLHNVGAHMALPIESSSRFYLQFSGIQVTGYHTFSSQLQQFF